jgi:hypothetical protein
MSSGREKLLNLQKIGQLKAEPSAPSEIKGLIRAAENRLRDAKNKSNSVDSRFSLAYDAAHSLALAALRKQGYRSENRFIVFELLPVTLEIPLGKARFLHDCHRRRNVMLYDGDLIEDESIVAELIAVAAELHAAVTR